MQGTQPCNWRVTRGLFQARGFATGISTALVFLLVRVGKKESGEKGEWAEFALVHAGASSAGKGERVLLHFWESSGCDAALSKRIVFFSYLEIVRCLSALHEIQDSISRTLSWKISINLSSPTGLVTCDISLFFSTCHPSSPSCHRCRLSS